MGGYLWLVTLTAPGSQAHELPNGQLCPCTPVGGVDLARWNASHSGRWNRLRTALRRHHPDLEFFRGVEVQTRGALHDHALVWSSSPLTVQGLRALALAAGFGHSVDLKPLAPNCKGAAHYVSKYVTKAADVRAEVPWWGQTVDQETGEVAEGLVDGRYRTWSMSRGWGMSMRDARLAAREIARRLQAALEEQAGELLAGAFGALPIVAGESPPPPS